MFESAINVALNAKPYAPSEEFADASSEALLVNRIDKDDAMDLMHESAKKFYKLSVCAFKPASQPIRPDTN